MINEKNETIRDLQHSLLSYQKLNNEVQRQNFRIMFELRQLKDNLSSKELELLKLQVEFQDLMKRFKDECQPYDKNKVNITSLKITLH